MKKKQQEISSDEESEQDINDDEDDEYVPPSKKYKKIKSIVKIDTEEFLSTLDRTGVSNQTAALIVNTALHSAGHDINNCSSSKS